MKINPITYFLSSIEISFKEIRIPMLIMVIPQCLIAGMVMIIIDKAIKNLLLTKKRENRKKKKGKKKKMKKDNNNKKKEKDNKKKR